MRNVIEVDNPHSLLTVAEVSLYLRIPLQTVYYLLQRGKITGHRIGGRWRVKRADLEVMLGEKKTEGDEA